MTELSGASHCTPAEGKTKFGSVGLLLPNLQCKVSLKCLQGRKESTTLNIKLALCLYLLFF